MPLLKTTEELQKVASVENNLDPETFAPYVQLAEDQYLNDVLGATFMASLQTQYDANTLDADNTKLLPYIHRVIGPLAVYHMTPNLLRIGNNGVQAVSSTDFTPANSTDIYFMRKEMREMGMNALDTLYTYLEANKTTYTIWAADPVYTQFKAYFISSATQFQKYVDISRSRVIYGKLVPMMANMESRYISATITEALFNDLKTKWANDTLSAQEKYLVCGDPAQPGGGYLCRAIALYTYQMAIKDRNLVEEIMVINNTRSENFKKNKEDFGDFSTITSDYWDLAEGAVNDAVRYLNDNASSTIFPLWFNSIKYINPLLPRTTTEYNNGGSTGSFFA